MFNRKATMAAVLWALCRNERQGKPYSSPKDLYPLVQDILGFSDEHVEVQRESYPYESGFQNEVRWAIKDLELGGYIVHGGRAKWSTS